MILKHELKEGMLVRYTTEIVDYYGIVDTFRVNNKRNHYTAIRWINHKYHSFDEPHLCEIFNNEFSKYWSIPS